VSFTAVSSSIFQERATCVDVGGGLVGREVVDVDGGGT
jgi:hypothetical protein